MRMRDLGGLSHRLGLRVLSLYRGQVLACLIFVLLVATVPHWVLGVVSYLSKPYIGHLGKASSFWIYCKDWNWGG